METDGGGWTVFQRRMDGTQFFSSGSLSSYISGFGNLNREFWLNLNNIHRLTMLNPAMNTTLRVDMDDFEGNTRFAKYSLFQVLDATTDYQLMIDGYSGDAGDSLASSDGQAFVARGRNSFGVLTSGWWRDPSLNDRQLLLLFQNENQHFANLNALTYYRTGEYIGVNRSEGIFPNGVFWSSWRGQFYSLRFTEMKLRREGSTLELRNSANRVFSSLVFLFISLSSYFCV
jgi:hypothetical protein